MDASIDYTTKFNIGDIVRYKKKHHLILKILPDEYGEGFGPIYYMLTLETGTYRSWRSINLDVAGKKKA